MSHATIPDLEPTEITVGETLEWTKDLSDFPASEFTLTYYFRGAGPGFNAVATADGDVHSITVPTTDTDDLVEGLYFWQAWATKGAEKHMVASGQVRIKKDFTSVSTGTVVDKRSKLKKIVEAIDDLVLGKASLDQQEYTIGNRSLRRIPIPELVELRKTYAGLYAQEVRRERRRSGKGYLRNINTKFEAPQ